MIAGEHNHHLRKRAKPSKRHRRARLSKRNERVMLPNRLPSTVATLVGVAVLVGLAGLATKTWNNTEDATKTLNDKRIRVRKEDEAAQLANEEEAASMTADYRDYMKGTMVKFLDSNPDMNLDSSDMKFQEWKALYLAENVDDGRPESKVLLELWKEVISS